MKKGFANFLASVYKSLENCFLFFITSSKAFLDMRLFCSFSPFELLILSFTKYLCGDNYVRNIKLDAVKNVKTSPISYFHKLPNWRLKNVWKCIFVFYITMSLCQLFVCLSVFPQLFNNNYNGLYLLILVIFLGSGRIP